MRLWHSSEIGHPIKRKESNSYPQAECEVIPVPKWSKKKTKEFIEERVRIHQEAVADQLMGRGITTLHSERALATTDSRYVLKKEGSERATKST